MGLGAVLSHEMNGEEHPVAYLIRNLTPAERNYFIVERESLAINFALASLRYYLFGKSLPFSSTVEGSERREQCKGQKVVSGFARLSIL